MVCVCGVSVPCVCVVSGSLLVLWCITCDDVYVVTRRAANALDYTEEYQSRCDWPAGWPEQISGKPNVGLNVLVIVLSDAVHAIL